MIKLNYIYIEKFSYSEYYILKLFSFLLNIMIFYDLVYFYLMLAYGLIIIR